MPSWIPGTSGSGSGGGGGGGGGNSGGSTWMNIDTERLRNIPGTSNLTGEDSAFKDMGIELTRQQRLIGFAGCLIGGFVISLLGSILLFSGSLTTFAILYSIGIVVALIGTGFLVGFMAQLKGMFKPVRVAATIILIIAFVLVWIGAFVIKSAILCLIFVIILYLAYAWYCLSYIPFARDFVRSIFAKFF